MSLWSKFTAIFHKKKLDADMAAEMRAHLDAQTQRNVAAGMSADDARAAAHRRFGGVVQIQERARDARYSRACEDLMRDLRFAARSLCKVPGFALPVVLMLGLGIGASVTTVSVVRQALFPEIPFPDPDRIVTVEEYSTLLSMTLSEDAPRYLSLRKDPGPFDAVAALRLDAMNLVRHGEPTVVDVARVTPDFFRVFGIEPVQGRAFLADEYVPGAASGAVVVLSHQLWQSALGEDPDIVGRGIELGGEIRRVVGILPARYRPIPGFPGGQAFLPLADETLATLAPGTAYISMVGRLRPEASIAEAVAAVETTKGPLAERSRWEKSLDARVTPIRSRYQPASPQTFWVILGAVGCLYAIALTNAVNLTLVRILGRQKELAVRVALGGGRTQLLRLLLAESLLLATAAGVAGLGFAWGGLHGVRILLEGWLPGPFALPAALDLATVIVTTGLIGLSGMTLAGLALWRVRNSRVQDALKDGAGALTHGRGVHRLRAGFVVTQAALAVVLLIGSGLMLRTLAALQRTGVGFDPARKVVVRTQLYESAQTKSIDPQLNERLAEALRRIPGVGRAVLADFVPASGAFASAEVRLSGQSDTDWTPSLLDAVSPEFFELLGLRLRTGRGFAGAYPGDPHIVVINEALARRLFPGEDPIGKRLDIVSDRDCEIVDVIADVRDKGPRAEVQPQCFIPTWQRLRNAGSLSAIVLQLEIEPSSTLLQAVSRAASAVDPRVVVRCNLLAGAVARFTRVERTTSILLQVFSALALALAAFGLFTLSAFSVAQRRRELGIRSALGAGETKLRGLILGASLRLTGLGIAIGLVTALAATRILRSVLFETSPHDPLVYLVVAGVLGAVAIAASWLPARRAAKIDPMIALRAE